MRIPSVRTWIIIILGTLLLVTNGFWVHAAIDQAVSNKYLDISLGNNKRALDTLLALIPSLKVAVTKDELIPEAERLTGSNAFDKEGCTWIGGLGFKFDEDGRLSDVTRSWNSGEQDACHYS